MLIFLPYVVPFVAGVLIWQNTLLPDTGWLNEALRALGWSNPPDWLNSPTWIYPGLVLVGIWGIGGAVIVNLAGLRSVPTELYDAARIDGAGWWGQLRHMTLPMMSPVIFYSLILGVVEVMQYFLVPFVLKNGTGEPGGTTYFFNLYIYKSFFTFQHMSYGATLAWLLFLVTWSHAWRCSLRPASGSTTPGSAEGLATDVAPEQSVRPAAAQRVARRAISRSRMRSASKSFLVTLIATCALAAFLAPLLQSASMALKTREQITQLGSPLWPADPQTFAYNGRNAGCL